MRYEPDRCRLKELYRTTGINQRMVHIITGIAESQLSLYANNKSTMTLAIAHTIAKAMNLPSSDVLYTWREISE
ncbi:helix-turn-helix domain-containing protein [Paenibacillus barcinonensis]|uniref:helix-turn-helix domain-containing protein n=1 Tax=Paenibacillus barcinonensis TaxID=198119 RepID=UPI001C11EC08|nr:helix-turn-helix transcriptional regulator [Paenibacillus barcinonensis]MBU5356092.1 helix-turn-helix domain-containing protein [Paenibacillus barcinonensis]